MLSGGMGLSAPILCVSKYSRVIGAPALVPAGASYLVRKAKDDSGVRLSLCSQPAFHVVSAEAQQTAQLERFGEVAAAGMAVIDGLLGQPKIGSECFR